jgi:hypothetical protein
MRLAMKHKLLQYVIILSFFLIAVPVGQTASTQAATPTFSLPAGTYANSKVTISDASSSATIYYTTNGTTPTTSSTKYTAPIVFNDSGTFTVKAIAVASGSNNSAVATVVYTIHPGVITPTFSPVAGTYTTSQSVTISDISTKTIYYTTDGSVPTTSSTPYSGPVTVASNETINAIAVLSGFTNSPVATAAYTIASVLPTPTFSVAAGTYTTAQSVTISDSSSGATIYYTTNGTTPTTTSTKYSGTAISVSTTETLEAMAVAPGYTNSAVATAAYTIQAGAADINFGGGFAASQGQMVLNGAAQLNGSGLQLTNGGTSQEGSAWYVTPVNVQSFTTNFTFQLTNPQANGITFTIQNQGTAALGIYGTGLGYEYIPTSVAVKFDLFNAGGEGPDSTGLYTDGAVPTVPAIDLSSTGINLHSGDTMAVQMVYNGTTLTMTMTDTVTKASYTTGFTINIPSTVGSNTAYIGFTGGTGGLTATQAILTWTYKN